MNTNWKSPAIPRVAISTIPFDHKGNVLVMHRTDKVRSAKNVWSFPSGLHDIGETLEVGMGRELMEEYNLKQLEFGIIGVYENIAGDSTESEQYHWVVLVAGSLVESFDDVINREPDKHDQFKIIDGMELMRDQFYASHPFHSTLSTWLQTNVREVLETVFAKEGI